MSAEELRSFLGWCAVFNYVILIIWSFGILLVRRGVYQLHSKWFPLTEEQFNRNNYLLVGFYKVLVLVFNVVPWLVLTVAG